MKNKNANEIQDIKYISVVCNEPNEKKTIFKYLKQDSAEQTHIPEINIVKKCIGFNIYF